MIREIPNSSGPSIGKDAWRAINLSLTRDLKWSKGEFVRIHETRIHDWITTKDLESLHRELPVHETLKRSGPLDLNHRGSLDLIQELMYRNSGLK
jgi:hypothetical protein